MTLTWTNNEAELNGRTLLISQLGKSVYVCEIKGVSQSPYAFRILCSGKSLQEVQQKAEELTRALPVELSKHLSGVHTGITTRNSDWMGMLPDESFADPYDDNYNSRWDIDPFEWGDRE